MEIKINLIPPRRKEVINEIRRLKLFLKLESGIFLIIALFVFFLVGLNHILGINLNMVSNNSELNQNKEGFEKITRFEKEFEEVNEKTGEIAILKNDQLYWSEVFSIISNNISDDISLSNLSTKNYQVLLAGKANDRDNLIRFKDRLAENSCLTDVNLPLSNLVSRDNVDFQMDFKIKEECIKRRK